MNEQELQEYRKAFARSGGLAYKKKYGPNAMSKLVNIRWAKHGKNQDKVDKVKKKAKKVTKLKE